MVAVTGAAHLGLGKLNLARGIRIAQCSEIRVESMQGEGEGAADSGSGSGALSSGVGEAGEDGEDSTLPSAGLPVEVDGEPWMQRGAFSISVSLRRGPRSIVLRRSGGSKGGGGGGGRGVSGGKYNSGLDSAPSRYSHSSEMSGGEPVPAQVPVPVQVPGVDGRWRQQREQEEEAEDEERRRRRRWREERRRRGSWGRRQRGDENMSTTITKNMLEDGKASSSSNNNNNNSSSSSAIFTSVLDRGILAGAIDGGQREFLLREFERERERATTAPTPTPPTVAKRDDVESSTLRLRKQAGERLNE